MDHVPCRERTFPLKLAPEYARCFRSYAQWLSHLLERLGRKTALQIWDHAFRQSADELLDEILSAAWRETEDDETDVDGQIADALAEQFPSPVGGTTGEDARQLIEDSKPFRQVRERFPSLRVSVEMGTYDSLHLFRGGLSTLAESLIELQGKQGEFIAYDAMLYPIIWQCEPQMAASEYLHMFATSPPASTRHGAGLELEVVRATESEAVIHITECEWARYYLERHPKVGYLMACSMDYASNRAANPDVRTQRTSTLMEGAELCDFRFYAIEPTTEPGT